MGETISQIERELSAERRELGRNLEELETKARELIDWRRHYQNHPAQFLGAAVAGGVVLGIIAGGSATRGSHTRLEKDFQRLTNALMGVASAKVMEFVGNLIPGFHDELHRDSTSSL